MKDWQRCTAGERATAVALGQAGLLNRRQALQAGFTPGNIDRILRNGSWLRVVTGVYQILPGDSWADSVQVTQVRAAWVGLLAVPGAVATGQCALAIHGVWGLPQQIQPEVALASSSYKSGPAGVRVRRFAPFPTTLRSGRHVATPLHALRQAVPELRRATAVSVLDSALNRGLIKAADLRELDRLLTGRRGARRARMWLRLTNGQSHSPFETRARLECHDAGLPPATAQAVVWDGGSGRVARGDLGWQRGDGTWVLADFDGRRYHSGPDAVYVDRARQNAIALAARHTHLRFTWEDLGTGLIPTTIARALRLH